MTQDQGRVDAVFEKLGFERIPPADPKIMGAPTQWKATEATRLGLGPLKRFTVQGDGSIEITGGI
jgi:hypothetical protein